MKIASTGIWLLWMVVDNASQGVKFSRKLGNVILYGSQQRERAEADYGGSGNNGCLTHYSETGKSVCDFMWHPGV